MGQMTEEQELQFSMEMALKSARVDLKRMQRDQEEEMLRSLARNLISQLKFYNWKIERGKPREAHSSHGQIGTGEQSTFKEFDDKAK